MKNNLSSGELRIVQNKKRWFLVPAIVAIVTAIALVLYAFLATCALNLSVDMAGGYSVIVKFSALTEDNYDQYTDKIQSIASSLEDKDGNEQCIKIAEFRRLGEFGTTSAIALSYHGVKGLTLEQMDELNEQFKLGLESLITHIAPSVSISGSEATLTYTRTMAAYQANIESAIKAALPAATITWTNPTPATVVEGEEYFTELKLGAIGSATELEVKEAATILDQFSGTIGEVERVSPSSNIYILNYGLSAMLVLLIVLLLYVLLRFRSLAFALTFALCVLLDLVMTFCLVAIFHVEITFAFVAALIAVMFFSSFSLFGLFDRIKENLRSRTQEESMAAMLNKTVKQTLMRVAVSALSLVIILTVVAVVCLIAGAPTMTTLALGTLFGVLSTVFTTLFFAPSLLSVMKKNMGAKTKAKDKTHSKKTTTTI